MNISSSNNNEHVISELNRTFKVQGCSLIMDKAGSI